MNKKGIGALPVVAVLLALTLFGFFLVNTAMRDCTSNKDCPLNAYCGADNECHEYPDNIVIEKNNLLLPAMILGIALVMAAFIYRGKSY